MAAWRAKSTSGFAAKSADRRRAVVPATARTRKNRQEKAGGLDRELDKIVRSEHEHGVTRKLTACRGAANNGGTSSGEAEEYLREIDGNGKNSAAGRIFGHQINIIELMSKSVSMAKGDNVIGGGGIGESRRRMAMAQYL